MYIKQVTIQGFKSYRNQTICDPFSPQHNVIVGRNGSGKSNFFFAIRFVLSDTYTSLGNTERTRLLHGEGLGVSVMSAFVEIVFDNADSRIPIEREEVTLRRTIGLKNDDYFLDGKHVNKTDVMNLLESSGFSRSNPYYIVQQGKIIQLAVMRDAERLNLLKEVAGTKVYDDRRAQSVQILEDTSTKKERIEEVLAYIEERLAELEDEKEELREYQQLDKDMRAIEYTIYDKELRKVREVVEKLDSDRIAESANRNRTFEDNAEEKRVLADLEQDLKAIKTDLAHTDRSKRILSEEKTESMQSVAKAELDVEELVGLADNETQDETRIDKELNELHRNIGKTEKEIAKVEPKVAELKEKQRDAEASHAKAKASQDALFGKQSRTSQFTSVDERDDWIDSEIASYQKSIRSKEKQRGVLSKEIEKHEQQIADNEEEAAEREQQIDQRKSRIEAINVEWKEAKKARDDHTNARKELWSDDAALDRQIEVAKSELSKAERSLHSSIGKSKSRGLEAVRNLVAKNKIKGVHGPLIELISCTDQYKTAVEVTAGDQLFNIVVDSDTVASQIIDLINRDKLEGRVTFLPLNRLRPPEAKYPPNPSRDFVAMVEKIQFDPKFAPAVKQIFGRTLICRDLAVANHYSAQPDMNMSCITLDGDKVNRKGGMTGGFIDDKASKMDLQSKASEHRQANHDANERATKIKTQIDNLDQEVTKETANVQRLESERTRLRQNYEHITADTRELERNTTRLREVLGSKEALKETCEAELANMNDKVQHYKDEKGTSLDSQLDAAEQSELADVTAELSSQQAVISECMDERSALETKFAGLKQKLEKHFKKREHELTQQKEEIGMTDRKEELESKQADLGKANDDLAKATQAVSDLDTKMSEQIKSRDECANALDEARAGERKRLSHGADADKRLERILQKRSQGLQKQEEYVRKIRELGALPKSFDRYTESSLKALYKQLSGVKRKLKDEKYARVNKKALDQYVSFSEQRDALINRKGDQDSADASIVELIRVLDGQKDEAIERTFKQVSMYFTEVFKELVPGGRANLIMQKRAAKDIAAEQAELDADEAAAVDAASDDDDEEEDGNSDDNSDDDDDDDEMDVDQAAKKAKGKGKAKAKPKGKGKGKAKAKGKGKKAASSAVVKAKGKIEQYIGVAVRVSFTGKSDETQLLQQLSGGQKSIVALALIFAIQRCDPAPFYLFDEIDAALDAAHRVAVADMIRRLTANAQFIVTTFRPEMLTHADKYYGVTFHNKVSKIGCVTKDQALEFIEDDQTGR